MLKIAVPIEKAKRNKPGNSEDSIWVKISAETNKINTVVDISRVPRELGGIEI